MLCRQALREALLGVIEQSDSVTVSHEVAPTSLSLLPSEDDSSTVQNGSSTVEIFDEKQNSLGEFDLVVDASGLHSPLRRYRVESATKQYSGRILIHGLIPDPEASAPALAAKLGQGTIMPIGRGSPYLAFQRCGAHLDSATSASRSLSLFGLLCFILFLPLSYPLFQPLSRCLSQPVSQPVFQPLSVSRSGPHSVSLGLYLQVRRLN